MKKGLFVFIFSILFTVSAWAAPFLVSEPQTNVTSYTVTLDGNLYEVPAQDLGNNTVRLHFDLEGLTDGDHEANVTSKNVWGESDVLPFYFNKTGPDCPSVLEISAQ